MRFLIKRYRYAIERRFRWMPLVFLPLFIYLIVSAINPDRFTVRQDTRISKETPISVTSSPVDFVRVGDAIFHYEDFFLDELALTRVAKDLDAIMLQPNADGQIPTLRTIVASVMSLKTSDENTVQVIYSGEDSNLGKALVNSFSQRLTERVADGLVRSNRDGSARSRAVPVKIEASLPIATGTENAPPKNEAGLRNQENIPQHGNTSAASQGMPGLIEIKEDLLSGVKTVQEHRAVWRHQRLIPSSKILLGSVAFMLLLLGVLDWLDPSFKSERQVARYLGLPILGALPDLEELSCSLKATESHSLHAV